MCVWGATEQPSCTQSVAPPFVAGGMVQGRGGMVQGNSFARVGGRGSGFWDCWGSIFMGDWGGYKVLAQTVN